VMETLPNIISMDARSPRSLVLMASKSAILA
jgi:hypothetical protein